MRKLKLAGFILILLAVLAAVAVLQPPAASAAPAALTDTPTPELTTEVPTQTPVVPTATSPVPTATPPGGVIPPGPTPTATQPSDGTPVETPQEPSEEPPRSGRARATDAPLLPQTGEGPPDSPVGPLSILFLGLIIGLAIGLGGRKLVKGTRPFLSSRR
jgi:hypothetical protein